MGITTLVIGAITPNRRYHAVLILLWLGTIFVDTLARFADIFGA